MAELARRMNGVPVRSLAQPGLLRQGMEELLKTLTPLRPASADAAEHLAALRAVADSRAALDQLLPLDDQRPQMTRALEAAANAVFVARGAEAPFDPARFESSAPPAELGSFAQELAQARRSIGEVASKSLMGSRASYARALASIANMVEAAGGGQRLSEQVNEIRFQSKRVQRAAQTELARAAWLREALQAAVDALGELTGGTRSEWTDEARRAVAHIDPHSQTSFQRAAVQDALRATVDAYAALEIRDVSTSKECAAASPK